MSKSTKTPFAAAIGAAFLATAAVSSYAMADANPFSAQELSSGYNLADNHAEGKEAEGKCGEGKCGEKKAKEGKCGDKAKEGKCGDKAKEGKCGDKAKEGKCGDKAKEGKCGDKAKKDGSCGGMQG